MILEPTQCRCCSHPLPASFPHGSQSAPDDWLWCSVLRLPGLRFGGGQEGEGQEFTEFLTALFFYLFFVQFFPKIHLNKILGIEKDAQEITELL